MPPSPLYIEVRRRILSSLAAGEWRPGDRLPAESALAAHFGVAISTLRAAVGELCTAGVLVRRQGKGTFVARHDLPGQRFRYSNVYDAQGSKVSTERRVLTMRRGHAVGADARLLSLTGAADSRVLRIVSALDSSGKPVALLEMVLPLRQFERLERAHLEGNGENLYALYQRVCGVTVLRMQERIFARNADERMARLLDLKRGHPLLCIERIGFTFGNQPVEIRRRTFEGLRHHYLFVHDHVE